MTRLAPVCPGAQSKATVAVWDFSQCAGLVLAPGEPSCARVGSWVCTGVPARVAGGAEGAAHCEAALTLGVLKGQHCVPQHAGFPADLALFTQGWARVGDERGGLHTHSSELPDSGRRTLS